MIKLLPILIIFFYMIQLESHADIEVSEANQVISKEETKNKIKNRKIDKSFLVVDKIGKTISGISFAKNWKDLKANSIVPSFHEIATGRDGIACLKTNSAHAILLLPFSRVRPKILKNKEKYKLEIQIFSGTALIYSPPDTSSLSKLGRGEMETGNGTFYAINDRKIGKYIFGVLTEESEISHQKLLGEDASIGLTTREYIVSSDIKKQKVRKISWKLQKAAGKMLDQCRDGKINFKEVKEEAKRIYALLNVAGLDFDNRKNLEYVPEFDFPRRFQKSKFSVGGSYVSSSINVTSDDGNSTSSLTTTGYTFGGKVQKIFNLANTWKPIGIHLNLGFDVKTSSSTSTGIETTNSTLINFESGPAIGINETTFVSLLLSYHQNDYLNTSSSTINGFEVGSVMSTKYAIDKVFGFGLSELHAQVFYQTNFSTPSFANVYTSSSNLGLILDYGNLFGETRYRFGYESESYFNVSDTRTDAKINAGLIYLF